MHWRGDEKNSSELKGYFRSRVLPEGVYSGERGGKLTTLGSDSFMAVPSNCFSWIHIDSPYNVSQGIADFLVGLQIVFFSLTCECRGIFSKGSLWQSLLSCTLLLKGGQRVAGLQTSVMWGQWRPVLEPGSLRKCDFPAATQAAAVGRVETLWPSAQVAWGLGPVCRITQKTHPPSLQIHLLERSCLGGENSIEVSLK